MSDKYAGYSLKWRIPVVQVLLIRDQKFFMIRRSNTGWMDGKYTVPSGHVKEGETYLKAAIRETKEEAGVALEAENVRFVHMNERDADEDGRVWDDLYFICADFEGQPHNAEPEKANDGAWYSYKNPPKDLMIPSVYFVLEQIKKGNFYSAYPQG